MNTHATDFPALASGDRFPRLAVRLSAAANDRYWAGAGVDHPARHERLLYPPMAANLTILLVQQVVPDPLLHAEQALSCVGRARAETDLTVDGVVADRFEKRGREYAVIESTVAMAGGAPLWRSRATFTPARVPARSAPRDSRRPAPRPDAPLGPDATRRMLHVDAGMMRAYSRAGNYHSDPDAARRLGLPGLVAQGMQICGPAYGVLLDAWGAGFLEHGELTARFVGMVVDEQTVEAAVDHDDTDARFEVRAGNGRVAALGTARRSARVD